MDLNSTETDSVIHTAINYKSVRHHNYREFTKEGYDKYLEETKDKKFMDDYNKFKQCINPKTGRKIKEGREIYTKLEYYYSNHSKYSEINFEEYIKEQEEIETEINKKNELVKIYNKEVDNARALVNNLVNWNDYILFQGKKYGMPEKVKNDIHVENNCGGVVFITGTLVRYTSTDRMWSWSWTSTTYNVHTCYICGFKYDTYKDSETTIGGLSR